MNSKEKLKEIIVQVQLEEQDNELWQKFIEVSKEGDLVEIVELLESEPGQLEFLTNNLKEKLDAFISRDSDKLNSIIKTEVEFIKDL